MVQNCTVNQPGNICGSVGFSRASPPEPQELKMPCDLSLGTPAGVSYFSPGFRLLDHFWQALWGPLDYACLVPSVLSDSLWPYGPWPARLLCPWGSPGKYTRVGCHFFGLWVCLKMGFPGGLDGKESTCNAGDMGLIAGLGRSPGGGHGNPLQYSCLENSYGQRSLAESMGLQSQTQLSNSAQHMFKNMLPFLKTSSWRRGARGKEAQEEGNKCILTADSGCCIAETSTTW